jgi:hypothetical protein
MSSRIVETLSGVGRRRFIGQLSAGSAAMVSGALGFGARRAEAHDERLTMVPAVAAKEWGVGSYRVRLNGRGQPVTRVVAVLLDATGQPLGELARTRHYRIEPFPYTKTDAGVTEQYTLEKRFLRTEELRLSWGRETIEIESDNDKATFGVKYNTRHLGWVKASLERHDVSAEITGILRYRPELVSVAGAAGRDLDQAFPDPPRDSETCCCDINCFGRSYSCGSVSILRTEACLQSEACVGSKCWNAYCIGCCDLGGCNCACVPDTDFFCYCVVPGTSCGCSIHCI